MNMNILDGLMIPIITVASLCIGYVMKKWLPTDDKWIPTTLFAFGALSGLILFGADYEGIVKGIVSGLAAVGLHQTFKQHLKLDTITDEDHEENQLLMAESMLEGDDLKEVKGE